MAQFIEKWYSLELSWVQFATWRSRHTKTCICRRPNTQSLMIQTHVHSKDTNTNKTWRGRNGLPEVGVRSRDIYLQKYKDKDMGIKTKTYTLRTQTRTQRPDNATCLSREARSSFMESERRGHPTIMRWLTLRKEKFFCAFHINSSMGVIYQRTNSTTHTSEKWAEGKKIRLI